MVYYCILSYILRQMIFEVPPKIKYGLKQVEKNRQRLKLGGIESYRCQESFYGGLRVWKCNYRINN